MGPRRARPALLCALCSPRPPCPAGSRVTALHPYPEQSVEGLLHGQRPDGPHCRRPRGVWPGASGLARCLVPSPFPEAPGEKVAVTGAFLEWSAVKVITGHKSRWSLVAVGTGQHQQQPRRKSVSGRREGLCAAGGSPAARPGAADRAGRPTQGCPIQHLPPVLRATWGPGSARHVLNSEAPVLLPGWHLFSVPHLVH